MLPFPIIPEPGTPINTFNGLVSVIIPAYNCAPTLPVSIESLKGQTYNNLEIIVVDDASTDDTEKIIGSRDDIQFIRQPENRGAGAARNTGAKAAKGEVLLFAEADGYYDDDYVEKILRYLHVPEAWASINLGRKVWTDKNNVLVRHTNDLHEAACRLILDGKRGTGAWAFKREAFDKVNGYDPECKIGQDLDLVHRIIEAGGKTIIGARSILYHKDPDNLRAYMRRAYRGGFHSGRFRALWHKARGPFYKASYTARYILLASWPAYLLAGLFIHPAILLLFFAVPVYLLGEDKTTLKAWGIGFSRKDVPTILATPVLLWLRRLAIGYGRIRSFFFRTK